MIIKIEELVYMTLCITVIIFQAYIRQAVCQAQATRGVYKIKQAPLFC